MPKDIEGEDLSLHIRLKDITQYAMGVANSTIATLSLWNIATNSYHEVPNGQTEIVPKTNSPEFVTSFDVKYSFSSVQKYKFTFYQMNTNTPPQDLTPFPVLGEVEFTLAQLFANYSDGFLELPVSKGGFAQIRAIRVVDVRDIFVVKMTGDLVTSNWISNPTPYFMISRLDERDDWIKVYQRKDPTVRSTVTPNWGTMMFSVQKLTNGDHSCPFRLQVYDDVNGKLIGELRVSINQLMHLDGVPLNLTHPDLKATGQKCGILTFSNPQIVTEPSWLDYLKDVTISFATAIDFSGSNGNPKSPSSLHYINPDDASFLNIYLQCIKSVGSIIIEYDTDKLVPVVGFGAKLRDPVTDRYGPTNHCFPLSKEEVVGVEGIMEVYKSCFDYIQLSGPTLLEPVIRKATEDARKAAETKLNYTVYLIITDGSIQDIEETTKAVIEASSEPISFIIMGVGSGDFTNMELLDSDKELLSFGDLKASRDIVQFVRFHPGMDPVLLSQHVLEEIPAQVTTYFQQKQKGEPDRNSLPI